MSAWISFFSFLFPSWKFFNRTGTVFRLEARWENGGDWSRVFAREELRFRWMSLLADADRLKHLLAHSLAERLAQDLNEMTAPSSRLDSNEHLKLLAELIASLPRTQDPRWVQVRLLACNPHRGDTTFDLFFESEPLALAEVRV